VSLACCLSVLAPCLSLLWIKLELRHAHESDYVLTSFNYDQLCLVSYYAVLELLLCCYVVTIWIVRVLYTSTVVLDSEYSLFWYTESKDSKDSTVVENTVQVLLSPVACGSCLCHTINSEYGRLSLREAAIIGSR
jgi:hypothetical protein